jgi:hypothetical protein
MLRRTVRDVLVGSANPATSDDIRTAQQAGPGDDGATGAGLVDALAAWQQVKEGVLRKFHLEASRLGKPKSPEGASSQPINGVTANLQTLPHFLRIIFLIALFPERAFLLHLSKRLCHVFDLIPNIKAYVDRGALVEIDARPSDCIAMATAQTITFSIFAPSARKMFANRS